MLAIALIAALATMQLDVLDRAIELHMEGRVEAALEQYDRALEGLADPVDRAVAQNNSCLILVELERADEALERCRRAEELLEGTDQPGLVADNRTNLALALQSLGDLAGARDALQEALGLTVAQDDPELEAMVRSNLGAVLTELGLFGDAALQYRAVEERATAAIDQDWAQEQVAIARVNRAVLLFDLGDARRALALLDDATTAALPEFGLEIGINRAVLYTRLGDPARALEVLDRLPPAEGAEAAIGVDRAAALRLLGETDASILAAEAASGIARDQGDLLEEMRALYQLGRSRLERGDLGEATDAAERALALALETESPEGGWSAHTLLAQLRHAGGEPDATDRHLHAALGLVESSRRTTPDLLLRAKFQSSQREVFDTAHALWGERAVGGDAVALAMAFSVVQRAKSRSLLDSLAGTGQQSRPRSLAEVQAELGDELLLEFFVGEEEVWRWAVTATAARVESMGSAEELEGAVAALLAGILGGQPDTPLRATLGQVLLPPSVDLTRVHIAADGFLHRLPFEVLGPTASPLGGTASLAYWPSGSFIRAATTSPRATTASFGGLAAPAPPGTRPAGTAAGLWEIWNTPLPGAQREIAQVREQLGFPGTLASGTAATEAAFWDLVATRPAVLHLAAHAIIDSEPGSSAILLSPAPGQDGLLRQQEIAAGALHVDLTVLAACRSVDLAGGRAGDALNSLTGAFLAAGARAVVASRWAVPDAGSEVFMQQFYYFLGRGLTAAEALREARVRLRANGYADRPDIWAAYLVVGDARVAEPGRAIPWVAAAAALLLAAAVALWAAARRRP